MHDTSNIAAGLFAIADALLALRDSRPPPDVARPSPPAIPPEFPVEAADLLAAADAMTAARAEAKAAREREQAAQIQIDDVMARIARRGLSDGELAPFVRYLYWLRPDITVRSIATMIGRSVAGVPVLAGPGPELLACPRCGAPVAARTRHSGPELCPRCGARPAQPGRPLV